MAAMAVAVTLALADALAEAGLLAVAGAEADVEVELGAVGWRGEVKPDPAGRSWGLSRKRLRPAVISGTGGAPVSWICDPDSSLGFSRACSCPSGGDGVPLR
jgi:hypothetical protein